MQRLLLIAMLMVASFCEAQRLTRAELGLLSPDTVTCTPVKDQFMSSTCWSFSSVSQLESELLRNGRDEVDLSEMFVARHSMMRKIERHLVLNGGNFFTPGGQFHDVVWVMKNYGMLPESAYPGRGRGEKKHDHAEMDTVLSGLVKYILSIGIKELNNGQRVIIDSILDSYYGKLPATFVYKSKTYTPKTYLSDYLGINPDDYVEITSYTHHPYYTKFVLEDKYNWTGDEYWNVSLKEFSDITDMALDNGYTVGWDGDADDPGFDYYNGLAYIPDTIGKDSTQQRQIDFKTQTTLLNHMMHVVGRTTDKNGAKWYYVKNSWGGDTNPLGGFLFMREDYFKMRTVAIIVNKKAIPVAIRKKMGI